MEENKKAEILLETGTNELEVMEFTIGGNHFGINVAKVIELMQYSRVITPMPNSNPYIEGVFKPRETILTVINLASYMGLPPSENNERDILIITNFNQITTAFHVHSVEAIHRISWDAIEKPDRSIYGGEEGLITGIARFDDRLIAIVDFEKIVTDISPQSGIRLESLKSLGKRQKSSRPILVAEDSPLLEKMILQALESTGFSNVTCCSNGAEAWDLLLSYKDNDGDISEYVAIVITDIEMPKLDGHRLVKLIREDERLNKLPVIIFSSLIDEDMRAKGASLGATAQISKPEIANLVHLIDKHILQ
jgi:two-component system chemotaxis response regulator CheV